MITYHAVIRVITEQVGVIPRILSLATDLPGVNLALSLHAPTQELRCQIVPAARAYNLVKLMAAVDSYIGARYTRRYKAQSAFLETLLEDC